MRRSFSSVLALTLFVSAAPSWSQIYKVTDDEQGVVFTDRPQAVDSSASQDVEKVELQEVNTASPVEIRPPASSSQEVAKAAEVIQPTVQITAPANESTIAMGPGNFSVSATVEPPLNHTERLELLMDGQSVASPQSSASWFIEGALRGPHDLVVRRVSTRGETLATSESVRVYVLRPSIRR